METRQITQLRVYKLIMNHVSDRAEDGTITAISTDYDKLVAWYHSQLAPEKWRDGRFLKTFAEGSPLEWFNPVTSLELNELGTFGHGIADEWIRETVYMDIIQKGRPNVIE